MTTTGRKPRVLVLGSLNVDTVFSVDHIARPGETIASSAVMVNAGGKGANQAVAFARAGAAVSMAGTVGEDGRWLIDELRWRGVDAGLVRVGPAPTGGAFIQVASGGENCIVLHGGGNRANARADMDEALSGFGPGDVVVLQNEINDLPYAMARAAERGLSIVLNPAPFDPALARDCPLGLVGTFVLNEVEAAGLLGREASPGDTLDGLTELYPGAELVVTLGARGSVCGRGAERFEAGAFRVEAVDSTAAGDTFLGFYMTARLAGAGPEGAMLRAAKAAALAVGKRGAMDSMPSAAEVDEAGLAYVRFA